MQLTVRNPEWDTRVRASFDEQKFMAHLGAELVHLAPGAVDLELGFKPELTQQHGLFHAGATTSIADSAAGYAAMTLFEADAEVLTSEFKLNLLNPARQERLLARGRVVKPGRTLTICRSDVYGLDQDGQSHIATGLFTLVSLSAGRV